MFAVTAYKLSEKLFFFLSEKLQFRLHTICFPYSLSKWENSTLEQLACHASMCAKTEGCDPSFIRMMYSALVTSADRLNLDKSITQLIQ